MISAEIAEAVRKVVSMWVEVSENWVVIEVGRYMEERVRAVPKRVPVVRGARRVAILQVLLVSSGWVW